MEKAISVSYLIPGAEIF